MTDFWIDTHAHIYAKEFDDDRADTLQRSFELNVSRIYMPNIDHTSIDGMMEVEAKYPEHCFSMMGLHPCYVKKDFEKELYVIEEWLDKRGFSAIGEIGTDLYWDKTFWREQKEAFEIQIGWAKKYQLPIVVHCRESIDETIELVQQNLDDKLTGIFHCFSGDLVQAKKIIEMGFYLGIGGVATFKNSGLDKVITDVPLDAIVLETDCPYLAPTPHRSKRNEPSYVPLIAQRVADIKKISISELQNATSQNAMKIFSQVG